MLSICIVGHFKPGKFFCLKLPSVQHQPNINDDTSMFSYSKTTFYTPLLYSQQYEFFVTAKSTGKGIQSHSLHISQLPRPDEERAKFADMRQNVNINIISCFSRSCINHSVEQRLHNKI